MKFILALLSLLLYFNQLFAQPGILDSSFGEHGVVIRDIPSLNTSVIVQKDGKIVTGSFGANGADTGFLLTRYLINGTVDSSFGKGGNAIFNNANYYGEHFNSLALLPDGKIIMVGDGQGSNLWNSHDILIAKSNSKGQIDSSFGNNGWLNIDFGEAESANVVMLQKDGKILVAGTTQANINTSHNFLVARILAEGVIDQTFGNKGITISNLLDNSEANSIAIQSDNKILIGGIYGESNSKFLLGRYLSDGKLDLSFGSNGFAFTDFSSNEENAFALVVQQDGKILQAGVMGLNLSLRHQNMAIVRFDNNGMLDNTFDEDGKMTILFAEGNSEVKSIALQENGKIILAGRIYNDINSFSDFALVRLSVDGIIDSSFAVSGRQITDLGGYEYCSASALQEDGKIIIVGSTFQTINSSTVVRFLGDDTERNKYVRIKHWLHHHGIAWEDKPNNLINYYSIQSSNNGNAFTEVARIFSNHHGGIQTYSAASNATANYRIAAVSNTGNITYSNTLTLTATPTIQLYPNPAKNNLQIQGLPAGTTKLMVTDISGNTKIIATANSTVYSINIGQLTSGNYLLHIKTANEVITKQFIKE